MFPLQEISFAEERGAVCRRSREYNVVCAQRFVKSPECQAQREAGVIHNVLLGERHEPEIDSRIVAGHYRLEEQFIYYRRHDS